MAVSEYPAAVKRCDAQLPPAWAASNRATLAHRGDAGADRRGFLAFFGETEQLVSAVTGGAHDIDLPTLKRVVHTLKGNVAIVVSYASARPLGW